MTKDNSDGEQSICDHDVKDNIAGQKKISWRVSRNYK